MRRAAGTYTKTLRSLLAATAQVAGEAEVIVAYAQEDETAAEVERAREPGVRYVRLKKIQSVALLRAEALQAARGEFVVMTEDHVTVGADWLARLLRAAEEQPEASGWGGPVRNGQTTWAGWLHYLVRWNAFFDGGARASQGERQVAQLAMANVMFRRSQLSQLAGRWEKGFWEWQMVPAMRRQFGRLVWVAEAAVTQHQQRGLVASIWMRGRQGRVYGSQQRSALALLPPFVAGKLWNRMRAAVSAHGEYHSIFWASTPVLGLHCGAWAVGELLGLLFGAGGSAKRTD